MRRRRHGSDWLQTKDMQVRSTTSESCQCNLAVLYENGVGVPQDN